MEDIDNELLISLVKERPILWDKTFEFYNSRLATNKTWQEVVSILIPSIESKSDKTKQAFVKNIIHRWNHIRDNYNRSLKRVERAKDSTKQPKPYYFSNLLGFLENVIQHRPGYYIKNMNINNDVVHKSESDNKNDDHNYDGNDTSETESIDSAEYRKHMATIPQDTPIQISSEPSTSLNENRSPKNKVIILETSIDTEENSLEGGLLSPKEEVITLDVCTSTGLVSSLLSDLLSPKDEVIYVGASRSTELNSSQGGILQAKDTTTELTSPQSDLLQTKVIMQDDFRSRSSSPQIEILSPKEEIIIIQDASISSELNSPQCPSPVDDEIVIQDIARSIELNYPQGGLPPGGGGVNEEVRHPDANATTSVDSSRSNETINRHLSFFKGIIPSLDELDEDEILEFQIEVLQILRTLRNKRQK